MISLHAWDQFPEEISSELIFQDELDEYDADLHSPLLSDTQVQAIIHSRGNPLFFNPLLEKGDSPTPTFMADTSGNFLFTPGLVHWVYGDPGSRKSLLLQTAVLNHAGIYVDAETNRIKVAMRIKEMEYDLNNAWRFSCPQNVSELEEVVNAILVSPPTFVALDSCQRLCGLMNLDPLDGKDIEVLFDKIIRPIANAGHAVAVVDHRPKSGASKEYAYGAMDKKAQSDVLILVEAVAEQRYSLLTLNKDRMFSFGVRGIQVGDQFAMLHLSDNPKKVYLTPLKGTTASGTPVPTKRDIDFKEVADRVYVAVRTHGPVTKSELSHIVGGKSETQLKARNQLINDGILTVTRGKSPYGGTAELISLSGAKWEVSRESDVSDIKTYAMARKPLINGA